MTIGTEVDEKIFIKFLTDTIFNELELEDRELFDKLKICLSHIFKDYVVYSYFSYDDI